MKYNPDIHHRRSVRLKDYDYSRRGLYFITICTQNRLCVFGQIKHDEMILNDAGNMIKSVWNEIQVRFDHVELDKFVIMPNHVHGTFVLHRRGEPCVRPVDVHSDSSGGHSPGDHNTPLDGHSPRDNQNPLGDHKDRPYGTLPHTVGRVIQAFKSITTHEYIIGVKQNDWPQFQDKLWQRNYYEHIIRDENELNLIREYIVDNPLKWELDRENPNVNQHGGEPQGAYNPLSWQNDKYYQVITK